MTYNFKDHKKGDSFIGVSFIICPVKPRSLGRGYKGLIISKKIIFNKKPFLT